MQPKLKHKKLYILIPILLIALSLGIAASFAFEINPSSPDEITQILTTQDLNKQSLLYRHLLERVGPSVAQDMLKNSGLPANGQSHLLNHTAGLYLYQKYGPAGLSMCKDYFLESCYHGFLIQAISDHGTSYLATIMDACQTKGPAVVAQCSHAFGHAFLALNGYANLPQTLKMCDDQAATIKNLIPFNCYDGVFMENVYGVHDGHPSPDRWLDEKNLNFPCDSDKIGSKYLTACWGNQPALLYELTGGNLSKVNTICQSLVSNQSLETSCMNGISRQINAASSGSPQKVNDLCKVMSGNWESKCMIDNATSYLSYGDHQTPFNICALTDPSIQKQCFISLASLSKTSNQNPQSLCEEVDIQNVKSLCLKNLQ